MARRLVLHGSDRDAARRRIDQLVVLYEDDWTLQKKPHLTRDDEVQRKTP